MMHLEDVIASAKRLKALAKHDTLRFPEGSDKHKHAKIRHRIYSDFVDRLEIKKESLVDLAEEVKARYGELKNKQSLTLEESAEKEALEELLLVLGEPTR